VEWPLSAETAAEQAPTKPVPRYKTFIPDTESSILVFFDISGSKRNGFLSVDAGYRLPPMGSSDPRDGHRFSDGGRTPGDGEKPAGYPLA